jgi:hypothetical protein
MVHEVHRLETRSKRPGAAVGDGLDRSSSRSEASRVPLSVRQRSVLSHLFMPGPSLARTHALGASIERSLRPRRPEAAHRRTSRFTCGHRRYTAFSIANEQVEIGRLVGRTAAAAINESRRGRASDLVEHIVEQAPRGRVALA